mmetsp:Transcript_20459/g.46436  ORF Transcript_20459/g.46436 Transcript_20459/m.46436 type:complete len:101 (-) Transcript_20459:988-1290(-)
MCPNRSDKIHDTCDINRAILDCIDSLQIFNLMNNPSLLYYRNFLLPNTDCNSFEGFKQNNFLRKKFYKLHEDEDFAGVREIVLSLSNLVEYLHDRNGACS